MSETFDSMEVHNNKMERMNGELRDREKVVRGVKREDSPLDRWAANLPQLCSATYGLREQDTRRGRANHREGQLQVADPDTERKQETESDF
jgi:hypothetical protein